MAADAGSVFHNGAGDGDRHRHDHKHASIAARSERDGAAADEDDRRNKLPRGFRCDQLHNEIHGAELFNDRGKRPGKQQNDDRRDDVRYAVKPCFESVSGGQNLRYHGCGQGSDAAEKRRTQQKRDRVAAVREKRSNEIQHEQSNAAERDPDRNRLSF